MYAQESHSRIRCTVFLSISRSSLISLTSLTHLVNLLQSNYIDIESTRSQCEMKNLRHLWNVNDDIKWIQMLVVKAFDSRFCRNTQTKDTCFTMYLLINSRYQLSYRCLRHTNRFCSSSSLVASSKINSFVFAVFASMHDSVAKSTSSRKLVRKLQTIHRWKNSRSHFVERVCWQQWQSLTCFNRSRICIVEEAAELVALKELRDSSRS